MTVRIRQEGPGDRERSLEVERAAFGSDEEPSIVEAVRDEEGSFALVAEDGGEILGHVQMSRGWIGETAILALGPIGVLPDRQGAGIGSALIEAAVVEARARSERAVILIGSPDLYPRFGFRPGAELGLSNPFHGLVPDEDFLVADLTEGGLEDRGPVRWHAAFGQPG